MSSNSLKVDDKEKLNNSRNIANATVDEDTNFELLYDEEDCPKRKRTPNLLKKRRKRDGDDEHLMNMNEFLRNSSNIFVLSPMLF